MKYIISFINFLAWVGAIVFVIIPMIEATSLDSPLHGEALAQECIAIMIKFAIFAGLIGVTSTLKTIFKK